MSFGPIKKANYTRSSQNNGKSRSVKSEAVINYRTFKVDKSLYNGNMFKCQNATGEAFFLNV